MAVDQGTICLFIQTCLQEFESQMSIRFERLGSLIETTATLCNVSKVRRESGDAIMFNRSQVFLPTQLITTEDTALLDGWEKPSLPSCVLDCGDAAGPALQEQQVFFTREDASDRKSILSDCRICDQQIKASLHPRCSRDSEMVYTDFDLLLDSDICMFLFLSKRGMPTANASLALQRYMLLSEIYGQGCFLPERSDSCLYSSNLFETNTRTGVG